MAIDFVRVAIEVLVFSKLSHYKPYFTIYWTYATCSYLIAFFMLNPNLVMRFKNVDFFTFWCNVGSVVCKRLYENVNTYYTLRSIHAHLSDRVYTSLSSPYKIWRICNILILWREIMLRSRQHEHMWVLHDGISDFDKICLWQCSYDTNKVT